MKFNFTSALIGAAFVLGIGLTMAFQVVVQPTPCLSPEQQEILDLLKIGYIDDCQGGGYKTLTVIGANFQVTNGLGTTDTTNGLGNLIVGYNENDIGSFCNRLGSHNIILGQDIEYSKYASLVAGYSVFMDSEYAAILESWHTIIHPNSSFSATIGGDSNQITGTQSTILGGAFNTVSGDGSLVGGFSNQALGSYNVVFGARNIANGNRCEVLGGIFNEAAGNDGAVVVGGAGNLADDSNTVVVGGQFNVASADYAVSVGGFVNTNTADHGVLSAGSNRSINGIHDWRAGSLFEDN